MFIDKEYLDRIIAGEVQQGLKNYPVTAIVGPRQCGKSTLIRHLVHYDRPFVYLDLERPSDLRKLDDPEWFLLNQKDKLLCIDEVQRKPELFPLIRSLVDDWGGNGHFLILGSASRDLLKQSSESLAGRITYKRLTPFLWEEVKGCVTIEEYLSRGGFPRSLLQEDEQVSFDWREDFIRTFLERDLLEWSGFSPATMRRLWQMLAHHNGQMVKLSAIGGALGVSHTSVRNYLDLLQQTFMVVMLPPLLSNEGKRLVKTPKVFVTDTGIVAALLGLSGFNQIAGHPVFGSLWETLVLMNIQGMFPACELFYYRTSNGAELDIVMQKSGRRVAIECKASMAPALTRGNGSAIADVSPVHTFIVAPVGKGYPVRSGITVVSLSELIERIGEIFA
ncbi:MAG: ATP-binding protein [Chlorobiaceae bacterium]|nr:ATP-binding protein [Chlorobiaceae bacterium]